MILHALVTDAAAGVQAAQAGATVIQLRLKIASTAQRVSAARALRSQLRRAGLSPLTVMNDDVAAALAAGVDAVHLGQGDGGLAEAKAAGIAVGRSVSTVAEAVVAIAEGALYLGAGPVWATPSKTDALPPIGLGGLAEIAAATDLPVIAIGGVDISNVEACRSAGASGVAVIRAVSDLGVLRERLLAAL